MEKIEEKVKYFLEKYNLLNSETPVLIAFSGGYDSMCLLDVLSRLCTNVVAIHLNHNWRGQESLKDEKNCKHFCDEKGVKFYSETLSAKIQKTETAARTARYDFFEKCAEKFNSKVIFTAHNANDNAETIIYRIAKGTGIYGLCGIAEKRGIFYRPLLTVKRSEIEAYCKKHNLNPNNDSSNSDTKYKRNLIRKNILPQLGSINPNAIETINSLSEVAKSDNAVIEEYLKTLKNPYETKNFLKFSTAVQARLIYNLFTQYNLNYDRAKIERAIKFIQENHTSKSGKTLSLNKNHSLFVNSKTIEIITKTTHTDLAVTILKEGSYEFEDKIFIIQKAAEKQVSEFPNDSELKAFVDLSGYEELTLRHRKDGDFIKPLGCCGTQKLKKYLNEKKVPAHKKDKMVFLASKNEILWAPALGLSEKIKVVNRPTHVLKLINSESKGV